MISLSAHLCRSLTLSGSRVKWETIERDRFIVLGLRTGAGMPLFLWMIRSIKLDAGIIFFYI